MDDLSSNITEDSNDKDNITYLSGLYKVVFRLRIICYIRKSCSSFRRWFKACAAWNPSFNEVERWEIQ